jgi:hypothetical protein
MASIGRSYIAECKQAATECTTEGTPLLQEGFKINFLLGASSTNAIGTWNALEVPIRTNMGRGKREKKN